MSISYEFSLLMCHRSWFEWLFFVSFFSVLFIIYWPGDTKEGEREKKKEINQSIAFAFRVSSLTSSIHLESIYIHTHTHIHTRIHTIVDIDYIQHFFRALSITNTRVDQMTRTSSTTNMDSTKKKSKKSNLAKIELKKLKSILPRLQQKPTSTPIEIVLETIRYIRQLEDQLIERIHTGKTQTFFSLDRFQIRHFVVSSNTLSDLSMDSSFLQDISNTDWSIYMKFELSSLTKVYLFSTHIDVYKHFSRKTRAFVFFHFACVFFSFSIILPMTSFYRCNEMEARESKRWNETTTTINLLRLDHRHVHTHLAWSIFISRSNCIVVVVLC